MKDLFSDLAVDYARYRPDYPAELYEWLLRQIPGRQLAWDAGTGNGQVARVLARHFERVEATDISEQQLAQAPELPNVRYSKQPAEHVDLRDSSVDLIASGTAAHWFDHTRFQPEVHRVAKPGAVIAIWAYHLLRSEQAVSDAVDELQNEILKDWWDPERDHVIRFYQTLPFDFDEIPAPRFEIRSRWSLSDLQGYLNTWSGLNKLRNAGHPDPLAPLIERIRRQRGDGDMEIRIPVFVRAGRVK